MASAIFEDPTAMNDIVMADSLCRAASTSYFPDVINQNLIDRMFPLNGALRTWLCHPPIDAVTPTMSIRYDTFRFCFFLRNRNSPYRVHNFVA